MPQDVLAVAGAEVQGPQEAQQLVGQAADVGLDRGVLAELEDLVVDLLLGLGDHFLDPGRVDSAVLDQPLHGQAGDLAADGVEAADHHHAGRIVHDDVHAGGLLEGPDVAAFAADDAALHVVVGDFHGGNGHLAGLLGGVPLDGRADDLAALVVGRLLGLFHLPLDQRGHLVLALILQTFEQQLAGLFHLHARDLEQLVLLLGDQDGELLILDIDVADSPLALLFLLLEVLFLLLQQAGLAFQDVLPLGKPHLVLSQLSADAVCLGGEFLLLLDGFGCRLDLGGFDDVLCFSLRTIDLPLEVSPSMVLARVRAFIWYDDGPEADAEDEADHGGRAGLKGDLH